MSVVCDKLSVQMLGPLSVRLRHQAVTPTAAKQRQLLALLALRAGQVVTVSTLAEELWTGHPPRSFAVTLQTYIFHLRRRLATALPDGQDTTRFLSTRHSGYLLDCATDVEDFQRLARDGRATAEAGDPRAASELLSRALALWQGRALADVRQGPVLHVEATALAQARLAVLERRIECDLLMNRYSDVTSELISLTAENPMNENFCGLLMRAYYHSGHTVQALEAFRRLRAALNHELGVEPGPRAQQIHHAILSGELTPARYGSLTAASAGSTRTGSPPRSRSDRFGSGSGPADRMSSNRNLRAIMAATRTASIMPR